MKGIFPAALLSVSLAVSVSPAFAGNYPPHANENRATPVSGGEVLGLKRAYFSLGDDLKLEVLWGGLPRQDLSALWYRFVGTQTPFASSSGRLILVQGDSYQSCGTRLIKRPDLSGRVTVTTKLLGYNLFLVTLVTENGQKLYAVIRSSDLFWGSAEDSADNAFLNKKGNYPAPL
jgi:hypothetical protein